MRGAIAMVVAGLAISALAGCYNAHPSAGAPCDLALDNCPTGQHCTMTGGGAFCYGPNTGFEIDSGTNGDPDAPRPDNAPSCYGTGLVNNLCGLMPMNDVMVTAARTINTAMVGGTNCDQIIAGGGASICLVVARDFSLASGITLSATGANPLVIVGTNSISIAGTLDAASHRGATDGPGAQASCGTGIDGAQGNGTVSNGGGAGGGAGGSFGTAGGGGGTGNQGSAGGTALGATSSLTSLVGGCPGGKGGNGRGMPSGGVPTGSGPGGHGGGAVYLITTGTLTISGVVNASGAGGGAGTDGWDSSGGGGGGGTGGFIGLDAPALSVTGAVYANGGSGGGGNGNDPAFHGSPGNDPSSPTAPAVGGAAGQNGGGNGGDGYASSVAAKKGDNATGQYSGGGGGGGGGGIIRLYGTSTPNGTFSPPPN